MFGLNGDQIFWLLVIILATCYWTVQNVLTIIDRRNARKHGIDPLAAKKDDDEEDDDDA